MSAQLELNLLAVNNHGLVLEVYIPDAVGVALRKANSLTELLLLSTKVTCTHNIKNPSIQEHILTGFASVVNNG